MVAPGGKAETYPPAPSVGLPVNPLPLHVETQAAAPAEWSTGLCECFDDVGNCCITCWCPCITFGQVAEIVDRGSSSCGASGALYTLVAFVTGCPCIYSCFYRSRLRSHYALPESPCPDFIVHCCCEGCALCQEYRELKNRGFDMNIGWHANVEKQTRGVTAPPLVGTGMVR
ncbi:unnamed protein product [Spirodela intermedia]|uniref:Uncharacterized protein n=1 Tax=Spirodela intermedia TaxID=51605 RepID=A0A7I8KSX4_SPIIN|nr:unnamed protein product [Spirodela intermedia]